MAKKKRKDIPFHIAKKFKQFDSTEGYKFWAQDESDAKLFCKKMQWAVGSLQEVDIPGFEGTMDELDNLVNIGAK